jgi:monovalent cation:H+ antiporter-2, CPA2 family
MDAHTTPILEIGLILLAAVAAGWLARRLHLPAIVGYLAVGLGFSPFTPGYVANREQLELLADVGVVLLLFEVGIEVDLTKLRRDHGAVLLAGPAQVVISTVIAGVAFLVAGLEPIAAAVIGLSVALSSSIVIVNITLSRRRTTDRPTEEALVGWAVMQDIVGVALAAILLSVMDPGGRSLGEAALGLVGFGIVTIVAARLLLPAVLSRLRDEHDLFLITSVGSGLALAGVGAALFGVPLALAAFVGGLAVTESHEANEARRRLRPFRDVFAVLFFVAIGTLVDPSQLGAAAPWIALLLGLVVIAKVAVAWILARLLRLHVRPLQLAVGLGQIGEFSFVLASVAVAAGTIDGVLFIAIIASVAISIAASSILVRLVPNAPPPAATDDPGPPRPIEVGGTAAG